jgi:periplasmic divalent cation tolerance protein
MEQPVDRMQAVFVYVTVPDEAIAANIAESIMASRLAACANILPGVSSIYWWNGGIEKSDEVVLIFKTRSDLLDRLTEAVIAAHPYDCPCVVALPIMGGNAQFLTWIADETKK